MTKKKPSRMTYLGGYSGRKGLLGILAFPEEFPSETEYTMLYMMLDDKWGQRQFDFDVASVTYLNLPKENYKAWWLVGKRGEVFEITGGEPNVDRIATAGTGSKNKFGYLNQIRTIDNELFICGHRRQVYQRKKKNWSLISEEILDASSKKPAGFEAIDGFSKTEIYAVGRNGEIWYFDGNKWHQVDSPTNRHLADVRCIDSKVWVVGDGGIIICGDKKGWQLVWDDEEPSENWWSVEGYKKRVYVAGNDFLGMIDDTQVVRVDVKIKSEVTTQTLHQKEGYLWSVGSDDILRFDGKSWKEFVSPENR